jgi:hypothetical protein
MSQKKVQLLNPLSGNINVAGVITASSFVGSGEGLTGVASTDNIQTATSAKFLNNVNVSGITTLASVNVSGSTTTSTLLVTGITTVGVVTGGTSISAGVYYGDGSALTGIDASTLKSGSDIKAQAVGTGVVVTGVLTATTMSASNAVFDGNVTVGGTITYQDATSIDVLGIGTFQQGIQVLANGANVTGIVTVGLTTIKSGEIEVVGVVTATTFVGELNSTTLDTVDGGAVVTGVLTATSFSGDGSALQNLPAAGLSTAERTGLGNTTIFLDLSNAQHHTITLAAGISTIDCTGGSVGESHSVVLINPSSVGTGVTVGFASDFFFPSGSEPSLPTGANDISLLSFVVKQTGAGGTEVLASAGLNYSN